jgi:hypothetical protein
MKKRALACICLMSVVACGGTDSAADRPGGEVDTVAADTFGAVPAVERTESLPEPEATAPMIEPAPAVQPVSQFSYTQIAPGIELGRARGRMAGLVVVRVVTARYQLRIVTGESFKNQGHSLRGYAELHGSTAVLSGGFVKSFYPPVPVGLVKVGGEVVNRPAVDEEILDGFLGLRNGRPTILPYDAVGSVGEWTEGLQSGPLLVFAGRSALPEGMAGLQSQTRNLIERRYARAFIAVDTEGRALLGHTGPIALRELADLLVRPASDGGLGCTAALNLSGGANAGLLIQSERVAMNVGDVDTPLANAIVIR